MNRIGLIAVLAVTVTAGGCCCFKKRTQPVAAAPVCAPAMQCAPAISCDPCAPQGVTYGMPTLGY
jgi:hypothetical protein